jgi:DNA polymerase-1
MKQEKPDAVYAAWDSPEKTFREEQYEAYKAHRPAVADDLKFQFPIARDIVTVFGIPSIEVPKYEADDLIGTLAVRGVSEGYDVTILTGDSDQFQLVQPGVKVRMTIKGVGQTDLFDSVKVREKYGIGPESIPDYKALVGDSSDNIPGVPGVGKVTAVRLLNEWGSLKNLLDHAEELPPGKVRDALISGRETAYMSLQLATIDRNAPFEGNIQRFSGPDDDWESAKELFNDLQFRSLVSRLPIGSSSEITAPAKKTLLAREACLPDECFAVSVNEIKDEVQFDAAIEEVRKAGIVSIRLHSDSGALVGAAFACASSHAWYVSFSNVSLQNESPLGGLFSDPPSVIPAAGVDILKKILQSASNKWMGYTTKLDMLQLMNCAMEIKDPSFDIVLAAYLLDPSRSSYPLMDISERYLNLRFEGDDNLAFEESLAREAALVFALKAPMEDRLRQDEILDLLVRVELPVVFVLAAMEKEGILVDRDWLSELSHRMNEQIKQVSDEIFEIAGERFNIGSTQQLQKILFDKLKLPAGKKIKTGYSTGADLLEGLAEEYEIARKILDYRELTKLKNTYADALPKLVDPKTGKIHTSYNQTVTATGRLSSSDPNLQNIPVRSEAGREIRKAFIAPEGQLLVSCDYSQIELRVFAHITHDPAMLKAFEEGQDIHTATATRLFGVSAEDVTSEMRSRAKTVNFAVIYGQSDFGLAANLGIKQAEAREFKEFYFQQFPGVQEYAKKTVELAKEKGYVQTLLGRRRYLPELKSGNHNIRQAAERAAVNMPVQGTAADIMKLAMIDVFRKLQDMCYNCTLLLQVHDELIFRIDEERVTVQTPQIVTIMENAYPLDAPLRVEAKCGRNWAEMRPLKHI